MNELNTQVMRAAAAMVPVQWEDAVLLDVACGRRQYVVDHLWDGARARIGADLDFSAVAANTGVYRRMRMPWLLPTMIVHLRRTV